MDWQMVTDIATIVSTAIFAVSIVFIWFQLRQQTKLTKWANAQTMANQVMNFNMELLKDKTLAELWRNGRLKYKNYDEATKERYESLLSWWLVLYETMTYLVKQGLLDQDFLAFWEKDLAGFVEDQLLKEYWEGKRHLYLKEFRVRVDQLITRQQVDNKPKDGQGIHSKS
jgi:hypothetical protein